MSIELTRKIQQSLKSIRHPAYEPGHPYGGWAVDHTGLLQQAPVWRLMPATYYTYVDPPPTEERESLLLFNGILYAQCEKNERTIWLRLQYISTPG